MKIYGIKLSSKFTWVYEEEKTQEEEKTINPEELYCEACHLYSSESGKQYVGFEFSLKMKESDMDALLGVKGKWFKVLLPRH